MQKSKGFTLIELLIVVTIIVILATIVLVSAGKFIKNKAKDNTIKVNLSSLKVAGEMYYNSNGNYDAVCSSDDFQRIKTAVLPIVRGGEYHCSSKSNSWVICAPLNRTSNGWCIDSEDVEMEVSSNSCDNIRDGNKSRCK